MPAAPSPLTKADFPEVQRSLLMPRRGRRGLRRDSLEGWTVCIEDADLEEVEQEWTLCDELDPPEPSASKPSYADIIVRPQPVFSDLPDMDAERDSEDEVAEFPAWRPRLATVVEESLEVGAKDRSRSAADRRRAKQTLKEPRASIDEEEESDIQGEVQRKLDRRRCNR